VTPLERWRARQAVIDRARASALAAAAFFHGAAAGRIAAQYQS